MGETPIEQPLSTQRGFACAVWAGVTLTCAMAVYGFDIIGLPGASVAWHLLALSTLILIAIAVHSEINAPHGIQEPIVCTSVSARAMVRSGFANTGTACLASLAMAVPRPPHD